MSRLEEQVPSGKKSEHSRKRRNGHNFDNMSAETASCEVCSAPAVIYKQYGAICCFSCRAFFRRNFSRQFFCVIGEGTCKVDMITRNNCKKCRMERCIQSGMRPELVNSTVKRQVQKKSIGPMHSNTSESLRNDKESEVLSDVSSDVFENIQSNDIEKLVELCCEEEHDSLNQAIDNSPISGTLLPFKKRRTDHYNEVPIKIYDQPVMSFTVEEEYQLCDLIVKREYFNEKSNSNMLESDPVLVQNAQERMFADIKENRKITFDEDYLDFFFNSSSKIAAKLLPDIFDEFKDLKTPSGCKCIEISYPATLSLMWACLDYNKDARLLDQDKFIGYNSSNSAFAAQMKKAEQLIANIQTRKGMGMQDYSHFISPWAQTWEEEVFFETTVKTLSNLIRGDMKASLIFQLFLFVSKSAETKNDAVLIKKIQDNLSSMLYRYLTSRHHRDEAAEQVHNFIGMVTKLHRCGHILTNRRIRMLTPDE